ncbi:Phosphatase [Gammaproteobacteria bacterium]
MRGTKKYRGLIHFHSCYSFDSLISLNDILDFAEREQLNFLILTDHDNTKSSVLLKEYAQKRKLDIEIPVAAEFYTEYGDVIAAFVNQDTHVTSYADLVKQVKNQEGLLLFPHPFLSHSNIEIIAQDVDLIEVFNSRISDDLNLRAKELAVKYSKNIYFASDAHLVRNLSGAIVEVEKNGDLKNSLLYGDIKQVSCVKTSYTELLFSQYIKAIKTFDVKLLCYLHVAFVNNLLKKFRF